MTLNEIAAWLALSPVADVVLNGVSIDSRTLNPGDLFVAINGERFDGHDYIRDAVARGAAAVLASRRLDDLAVPQLVMPCTMEALGMIATHHRKRLGCQTIAVTGSNGKTTVKEMIAALLPQPAFATPGNLNNHLGVALSLLKLTPYHRYAVFELGANHRGEIAHTVSMVKPSVTLINNVAPAHLQGFGSLEGVIEAKGEIHRGLLPDGVAVINADDPSASRWDHHLTDKRVVHFSIKTPRDVYARDVQLHGATGSSFTVVMPEGEVGVHLQVPGLHNVSNAVAAMTCVRALGISVLDSADVLAAFTGVAGRLMFRRGRAKAHIIDDTYNANLRSVLAALDVLAAQPGQRILVLGDMGELGEHAAAHHTEIGHAAQEKGIDRVLTCGTHSEATAHAFGGRGKHYPSHDALVMALLTALDANTTVLVKGSRSSAMERVVHQLVE